MTGHLVFRYLQPQNTFQILGKPCRSEKVLPSGVSATEHSIDAQDAPVRYGLNDADRYNLPWTDTDRLRITAAGAQSQCTERLSGATDAPPRMETIRIIR